MAIFVQEIDFGAPTALNVDTVGTDPLNSQTSFTPQTPNAITEIRNLVDPAAGLIYNLFVRRLDGSKRLIGTSADFTTTLNRAQTQMPFPLGAGFFQWVEQQILGALTAQKYIIKYQAPLNV